jgi:SAM-dependent methyltransferase
MKINHLLYSSKNSRREQQFSLERQRGFKHVFNGASDHCSGIGPRPSECKSATLAFYAKNAQKFCRSTAHRNLNKLYAPFLNELSPGACILDAGCGSGRDTKAFLAKGYQVEAIDISPQLAQMTTEFTRHNCRVMSFQEMNFKDEFDGIWACASLLHSPHNEIGVILDRFAKAKREGFSMFL